MNTHKISPHDKCTEENVVNAKWNGNSCNRELKVLKVEKPFDVEERFKVLEINLNSMYMNMCQKFIKLKSLSSLSRATNELPNHIKIYMRKKRVLETEQEKSIKHLTPPIAIYMRSFHRQN